MGDWMSSVRVIIGMGGLGEFVRGAGSPLTPIACVRSWVRAGLGLNKGMWVHGDRVRWVEL